MCFNTCLESNFLMWGRSSDGRVLTYHARGTGIDARRLQTSFNFVYTYVDTMYHLLNPQNKLYSQLCSGAC